LIYGESLGPCAVAERRYPMADDKQNGVGVLIARSASGCKAHLFSLDRQASDIYYSSVTVPGDGNAVPLREPEHGL
jgi:hypothetical protein